MLGSRWDNCNDDGAYDGKLEKVCHKGNQFEKGASASWHGGGAATACAQCLVKGNSASMEQMES